MLIKPGIGPEYTPMASQPVGGADIKVELINLIGIGSFHKRFRVYKTMIRCNSPVSAVCQLTRKRPLPGRDCMGREQRDIPGLVWEWLAETRSGAC